jgi:type IV pilus assembly protein PilB
VSIPAHTGGMFLARADEQGPARRRRLGELLVSHGLLTDEQLKHALTQQGQVLGGQRRRLGRVVVDAGFLTEKQLAYALSDLLNLELVDLSEFTLDLSVARTLPRRVAERHGMLVIGREDHVIKVATADPTNIVALDDVKLYTGATSVTVVVSTESQIQDELRRAWAILEQDAELSQIAADEADATDEHDLESAADQGPTVRLATSIVTEAVRSRASDIHVEPQADGLRIRYRIDGMLRDIMRVPRHSAAALVSRLKIVSGLDIAERRLPQDGRTRLTVDGNVVDARVSSLPSVHGEKIVIRLLASGDSVPSVTQLGLDEQQLEILLSGSVAPQGLVLITGPTGSGKTHTLYSVLSHMATPDKNVVTLEDPVEIQLPGITQVQTNDRAGLSFSKGLRSILRQDPDVVLVGEVRDSETAELALQASMTGHLVLTTLHTNDAVAALTRLVDMGIQPFLIASSLSLVIAQRLVRRPCVDCAAPYTPSARVLALLGLNEGDLVGATPMRGRGCGECGGTGYRGRTGIFEVLPVTASVRSVLSHTPTEAAVGAAARAAGMTTLRGSGLARARRGETTFEEILRVTQVDATEGQRCSACDRAVDDDMIACPWCETIVDRGHCTSCARALEAGWKICPWCRTAAAQSVAMAQIGVRLPRLLVVGDDGAVHSLIQSAVGTAMDVDVATNADDALTAVWDSNYDGVVVDHDLPGVGGAELLRLLRTGSRTAALPLMLVGEFDENSPGIGESHVGGVDEVVTLSASPAEMMTRLTLLTERSPHAAVRHGSAAANGAAAGNGASPQTDEPVESTADSEPVKVNRRVRSVPVPSERRTRQSANRPKS